MSTSTGDALFTSHQATSGFVNPPAGQEPGWGVAAFDLIAGVDGQGLGAKLSLPTTRSDTYVTVVAKISLTGTTLDGRPVVADNFEFPIDVCYGCLLFFPSEANNPGLPQPNCAETGAMDYMRPCFFGQDVEVDCRVCKERMTSELCDP